MIQEKRINKINKNKKLKKNIQIGAIALCACAFLGANGYIYSQGMKATEQATHVVRSVTEEHEKNIEAFQSAENRLWKDSYRREPRRTYIRVGKSYCSRPENYSSRVKSKTSF